MAKEKPDWIKAKAMFEAGKSLRQIAAETYIDNSNISKRAKKESWQRTAELPQLINDAVSVQERITALDLPHRQVVEKEVDERVRHINFFNKATLKNISSMLGKINSDTEIMEHRIAQAAIKDGRDTVLGKEPTTAVQVNNSVETAPRIEKVVYEVVYPDK